MFGCIMLLTLFLRVIATRAQALARNRRAAPAVCADKTDTMRRVYSGPFRSLLFLALSLSAFTTSRAQERRPKPEAAAPNQADVDVLAKSAEHDLMNKDYSAAAQKYERLAQLQPQSANIYNNLGLAYRMGGRRDDAIKAFEKALALNPDLASANLLAGISYIELNQPARAIVPLERALDRDPSNRDALLALASAYFGLNQFDRAVAVYEREVKLRRNDADAWYAMGLCFEHLAEASTRRLSETAPESSYTHKIIGEYLIEQDAGVEAEEAFRRAISSAASRDDDSLHAGLGFAHLRLGEFNKAQDEFRAELDLHSGNLDGKLGLAALGLQQKEWSNAGRYLCEIYTADQGYFESRLDFLISLLPDSALAQALDAGGVSPPGSRCDAMRGLLQSEATSTKPVLANTEAFAAADSKARRADAPSGVNRAGARRAAESGRFGECARLLQQMSPLSADDRLLLARCNCLTGRFLLAFETAQTVTKAEPKNPAALYWQAEAARRLAQAALQRAMVMSPDSWQGHLLLGDLYRQRKQYEVAISHYQAAARLKADSPGPFLGLATIYWQTGQYAQAEVALKAALHTAPDNALANFELGDVYVRQRRFEEALPYLQKHIAQAGNLLAAHGDLGKALAALGRNQEAITELLKALPTDRLGEIHYQLSQLYKKEGQPDLARQALAESEDLRNREHETQGRHLERAVDARQDATAPKP